jgi:acyl-homoserine lactone synthase
MVIFARGFHEPLRVPELRQMFEARKRVFVDLLRWDVPVLEGRYELDQFDDPLATYILITDADGRHAGSARLLPTMRPHILDTLFPELCAAPPPRGPSILEITRFCLGRELSAGERLETRNQLVSALVAYALEHDVHTYTGVAEMGWLQQILAFGWHCRPLGLPRICCGKMLGALRIDISPETPELLTRSGIFRDAPLAPAPALEAA